jgi:hypothetical protein
MIKALKRNVFTHLSTDATFRSTAAKSLSGNGLTDSKVHLVGVVGPAISIILGPKSSSELSKLLIEVMKTDFSHIRMAGRHRRRVTSAAVGRVTGADCNLSDDQMV